jgi:uncharacterized surface protein with fasciclin (FAS1) repeats
MKFTNKYGIVMLVLLTVGYLIACNKKWEEHNEITDPAIANNLYQVISKNSSLTKFSELLVKSGYDKIIATSKTYTVWAPTDQALAGLDASILTDSAKLRAFVGNHIANLAHPTGGADQRIAMLNGKYNAFVGTTFDSATISTANLYAANGVYHVIDKFVPRVDNIWEFVNNSTAYPLFKLSVTALNYTFFDSTKATQIGADAATGAPIWDSTNAKFERNSFLDRVQNIADETKEYTLFVLSDNAFTTEYNKLSPWFKTATNNADSTKNLASYHLIKDLAVKGAYSAAQLPDTLLSTFGVKVPIDKSKIVASYKTSNGFVHVMSEVNFTLTNKFPPIIIEGETPTSFATTDRGANTFYRIRVNPNNGVTFKDILMQNYGFANYFIHYRLRSIPSMRYNAVWVAVNDVQTTPLWAQRLAIDSSNNPSMPASFTKTIAFRDYSEVPLGQFNIASFRNTFSLFVLGPTTSSTASGINSITLDYIKLVPAF